MLRLAPVTSLNGTWKMQPEKAALDEPKGERWIEVPVPMPWTAYFAPSSGVPAKMIPRRMAWYRRGIIVPDIPPASRLILHFEAVNFYAVVFINGKRCGEHAGDAIPFDVDISDFVTPRHDATILVGVQDMSYAELPEPGRGRGVVKKLAYPALANHPGICGAVSMRLIPELHVVSVNVRTTLPARGAGVLDEGRIRVTVTVKNETGRALAFSLTNEVYDGARQALAFAPIRGVVGAGEQTEIDMGTTWDTASLWWPDEPHLYTLRTALWSAVPDPTVPGALDLIGDVVDRIHTPVGFREFRAEGDRFLLNNVPIQLRAESLCPISGQLFGELRPGTETPVEPEQAREILSALKRQRGLNAVRFHRMPPSPALLDAADQAGLMAIVEFPLPDDELRYAVDSPKFWANAAELARQWVATRAHHPAVVMWSVDQGMVRRYGLRVAEGLSGIVRAVADADPTRPIENSGDAALVEDETAAAGRPVSVMYPATGVALRTAGRYEPESVRGRLLPQRGAMDSPAMPDRPTDRPLTIMEHARRALTPNALAFFLGDAAYAAGVELAAASAGLAAFEMGACRLSNLAAIHTIGRPAPPEVTGDAASPVVALPTGLFANFYAGTRFVERLVLRNDTRFDQDVALVCRFTKADGKTAEQRDEMLMKAGSQAETSVAADLPDLGPAQEADAASSFLAEFSVALTGTRAGSFESRRKIAIWPRVRATGDRRIGLYSPVGRTAAALSAVGAKYSAAHGAPHGEFDTIIIGENALEQGSSPDPDAIRSFVAGGGLAVVLAQRAIPYDLSPVTTVLDGERAASVTFVRDAEHRVLEGLSSFEMRWWQDDHRVAAACFRKPAFGNFRCLIDAGGPGGLRWAAALEVFHGRGSYIFSQMDLVEKAARAPIAGLLLARLASAVPSWRAVDARTVAGEERFAHVGVSCPALPSDFDGDELQGVQVVLLTGDGLCRLSAPQLRALGGWVHHGGCLVVHHLLPGQQKALARVTPDEIELVESAEDRLVLNRPGCGLARGLSSADLYFVDHGARYLGPTPRKVAAADTIIRARGNVTGVASTVSSPLEYGLLTLHAGKGRIILDQVRWDVETGSDSRAARYISSLLTNLGVAIERPAAVEPSRNCSCIDISAACNAGLADAIPGDGEGWTDRGPDNDLGAFSPGLIIAGRQAHGPEQGRGAAGVPFRVLGGEAAARNCCVLGPARPPDAPPIELGQPAGSLAFLVACEGHVKHGVAIAHFTVRYEDGLETQVPLRYGVGVLDWNERARALDNASVAWRGFTALGEPAALYAKKWPNTRPDKPVKSVTFSSTRTAAVPILLAMTAIG